MKQKIIWMQHLSIGLLISNILFFLFSCETTWVEDPDNIEYCYINKTQHLIGITSYNMQYDSGYVILPSDTLKLTDDLGTGGSFNNFLIADADSVSVVFDFSRRLFFTPDSTSNRNIIKLYNYEYLLVEDIDGYFTYHNFTFEFTEEDYENAVEK